LDCESRHCQLMAVEPLGDFCLEISAACTGIRVACEASWQKSQSSVDKWVAEAFQTAMVKTNISGKVPVHFAKTTFCDPRWTQLTSAGEKPKTQPASPEHTGRSPGKKLLIDAEVSPPKRARLEDSPVAERVAFAPSPSRTTRVKAVPQSLEESDEVPADADCFKPVSLFPRAEVAKPMHVMAVRPAGAAPPVPAAFAQPSNTEPTEEIHPPAPTATTAQWQSSALFAAPPPSPPTRVTAEKSLVSKLRPPASGLQGMSETKLKEDAGDMVPEPENKPNSTKPGQDSHHTTPVKVSERIQMFERNTTPASRPALVAAAASTSRLVSNHQGSASAKAVRPGAPISASVPPLPPGTAPGGVVDGSSLFTPQSRVVQPISDAVQPKDLFGNVSDLVSSKGGASAKNPARPVKSGLSNSASASSFKAKDAASISSLASAGGSYSQTQIGMKGESEREKTAMADACDRLASGSKREDVAKPKSLKAAEQARLQEEKRQRERQERDEQRERARASAAIAAATLSDDSFGASRSQTKLTASAVAAASRSATTKKTIRGPADVNDGEASTSSAPLQDAPGDASVLGRKGPKPAVPLFRDYARELRQKVLPPKKLDDNYEISEPEDSDGDQDDDARRTQKHVPKWCATFLADMQSQADIDPDTIFGRVPHCNMDEIFTDDLYSQAVGKNRPKRARGSSGDWKRDRLTRTEIQDYKSRMGHRRVWDEESGAKAESSAHGLPGSKR